MAFKTLRELVNRTQVLLSQVSGNAVQLYSEDRIAVHVQTCFNMVFDEDFWDDFVQWFESDLDGTYGSPTADISSIVRFSDIQHVYPENSDVPLPKLPTTNVNPFKLAGTTPRYFAPDQTANKIFRIFPKLSVNHIAIKARIKPEDFTPDVTVRMDEDLLCHGAAWMYAEADGNNPGHAETMQTIFERRLSQLKSNQDDGVVELDPRVRKTNERWEEL